jgi:hypothetical protein
MLPNRRCSKNSGGGIAPAANGGLIEGVSRTVNAFRLARTAGTGTYAVRKVLMRLNFRDSPGIG